MKSLKDAADELEITLRTLFDWIKKGRIESLKISNHRFIKSEELLRFRVPVGQSRCSKCAEIRLVEEFVESSKMCKACRRLKYERNKIAILARSHRWNKKNADRKKEINRLWNAANKDRIKKWLEDNKDKHAAYKRALYYGINEDQ